MEMHPLQVQSLKELFVNNIIEQILTGSLKKGERLPSERVIAEEMQISRNVVRVGLAELTALGFLRVEPRRGTYVGDYQRDGNMAMLDAICRSPVPVTPDILYNLLDFRMTVMVKAAGRCAETRTRGDINRMEKLLEEQDTLQNGDNSEFTRIDYEFHKEMYITSGNSIYTMIHNSIRTLYLSMAGAFYEALQDKTPVRHRHRQILEAIRRRDPEGAEQGMLEVLEMGNRMMKELSYLPAKSEKSQTLTFI